MRRRAAIAALGAALATATALSLRAAPARVGVLGISDVVSGLVAVLRTRLRELGLEDGRDVEFVVRSGRAAVAGLDGMMAELLALDPAVIVASGLAAVRAAHEATRNVPIVALSGDLVEAGLVRSFAQPGGNITGVSFVGAELNAKRLEILAELLPRPATVLILTDPQSGTPLPDLEGTARVLAIELVVAEASDPAQIEQALTNAAARRIAGINVLASPILNAHNRRIVELAAGLRLPAIFQWPENAMEGGLIAYGPSLVAMYAKLAELVARILRGARPHEVPVERPLRFELVINLRAARALGLTIPPSLLARADEVIE
jgi:putative ABC transport system substrate-binding protein